MSNEGGAGSRRSEASLSKGRRGLGRGRRFCFRKAQRGWASIFIFFFDFRALSAFQLGVRGGWGAVFLLSEKPNGMGVNIHLFFRCSGAFSFSRRGGGVGSLATPRPPPRPAQRPLPRAAPLEPASTPGARPVLHDDLYPGPNIKTSPPTPLREK